MENDPRHADFAAAVETVEAATWMSLPVIEATEPLLDDRGGIAATALFGGLKYPLVNRVVGLGLGRPVQTAVLDRILALYEARGAGCIFVPTAPTARPSTLPRLLSERGFEPAMREAKLYRSTKNPPRLDPHDRVIKAKDEDYEVVLNLYVSAGMDPTWAEVTAGNLGAPNWHHYMALDGSKPVALGSLFVSQGFAYCLPGWTLPAYRHRGYQRALAAHRIAAAADMGCEWITANLDVTDDPIGFTIRSYTRLGFELLYVRKTHIRHHSDVPLPDAYSRRFLIPSN